MSEKAVLTFCQHCHMKCRIFCHVAGGKITRITNAMGVDCPKNVYSHELLYHPDRLIHPLKKVGRRGEGKWQRVSWDEALGILADRFGEIKAKCGVEAIANVKGCGHKHMARFSSILFSHVVGTPNMMDIGLTCNLPSTFMSKVTFGDANINFDTGPQYEYSRCILLWGSSRWNTGPPHADSIERARSEGAKLVVVDPRPPMKQADLWLRIRPGTDDALALGMLNVVITEGIYKKAFVEEWCTGFDALKELVQEYTPEKVANITWIPAEQIIEAARLYAINSPSCLHLRLGGGGGMDINASQSARAIAILMALAGDIDVPGGNLLADQLGGFKEIMPVSELEDLPFPPGVEERRLGAKEFPLIAGSSKTVKHIQPRRCAHNPTCLKAMLSGDIKALFIPGANLIASFQDSKLVWKALEKLEFLVSVDLFMTPTTELADLALPAAHFLEAEVPMRAYQSMGPNHNNYILAPPRVIEPMGECWDDRKIVIELAKKMGVKIPWNTVEDLNDWQLEKVGVKYSDIRDKRGHQMTFPLRFKKYEEAGFDTPSGKIELYSSILGDLGYDPLPYYAEPHESIYSAPEMVKDYPLIMIDHRDIAYTHSEFRQLPSIRGRLPEQKIEINPQTAAELGIGEGDEIYIERPKFEHRVRGKAKFVPELHPKVISCLCLWWFPEKPSPEHGCFDANTNVFISIEPPYDPINGNYQVRGLLCRVGKLCS